MVIQYEGSFNFQMQEMLTSLSQDSVATFVIAFLQRHQIPFKQSRSKGIYYLDHPYEPVISCSLDDVPNLEDMSLLYELEWENNPLSYIENTITEKNELGVFLQLKMLQKYPNLNFIFSKNNKGYRDLQELFIREAIILI